MVDIEGILEEVVVKVMGRASRKNAFWLISMDRDCSGNPGWVLGTQPKWVGLPNLADVLGRTKYPKPSLGSQ
jgi:hypothetical protein